MKKIFIISGKMYYASSVQEALSQHRVETLKNTILK